MVFCCWTFWPCASCLYTICTLPLTEVIERGRQLWKNLRHHMATEAGPDVAARVVQYLAERGTWKADKLNSVEKDRKQRRERDADSSRNWLHLDKAIARCAPCGENCVFPDRFVWECCLCVFPDRRHACGLQVIK